MNTKLSEFLETVKSEPWKYSICIASTLVAGIVGVKIWNTLSQNKKKVTAPEGTVVLNHLGRGQWVPSYSAFGVKVESYLRLANIKYVISSDFKKSSKEKWPWIEYNGKEYADSEFIIEFLNKEFNVDLNSHLTPEQKGIGRAVQKMVEENLYWCLVADRWLYDPTKGVYNAINLSTPFMYLIRYNLRKQLYAQGTGRHSEEEVRHIMMLDLEAISNVLGKKKFLFGDRISQYDFAVFGMLCEMLYQGFGGFAPKYIKEFPNLCTYCESMKAAIWPDWDQCNTAGGTRKALK